LNLGYNKKARSVKVEICGSKLLKLVYYNNTDKKAFYSENSILFVPIVNALEKKLPKKQRLAKSVKKKK